MVMVGNWLLCEDHAKVSLPALVDKYQSVNQSRVYASFWFFLVVCFISNFAFASLFVLSQTVPRKEMFSYASVYVFVVVCVISNFAYESICFVTKCAS